MTTSTMASRAANCAGLNWVTARRHACGCSHARAPLPLVCGDVPGKSLRWSGGRARTPGGVASGRSGRVRVLGINCFSHDTAACLLEDGRLIALAEEERFNRERHTKRFPDQAI